MSGPCRDCPNHREPPLDPPAEREPSDLSAEEIASIKADERYDRERAK